MALIDHTLFGIVDKVQIATDMIRHYEPEEGYYVAISYGKDSAVIYDLVKRAGVKADYHHGLTTCDPPELIMHGKKNYPDVIVHRPEKTMWQLIVECKWPPTRQARYCCKYLKENVGNSGERFVITGVRKEESARRKKIWKTHVQYCRRVTGKKYLMPILEWSTEEVWEYIKLNNLPYCSLYDEGFTRIGCIMCPLASQELRKMHMERWPKIADAYKRAIFRSWEVNRMADRDIKFKDARNMWEWWATGWTEFDDNDDDQGELFS